MSTKKVIELSDKNTPDLFMFDAEELRSGLIDLRDMVRSLLRCAPENFERSVSDVMETMYILDWLVEEADFKEAERPQE